MKNLVLFMGAGFTKAFCNTAPVGTDLLLKSLDASFDDDDVTNKGKNFIEKVFYKMAPDRCPKIEDVLSLLDYSIVRMEPLQGYTVRNLSEVRGAIVHLIARVLERNLNTLTIDPNDFVAKLLALKNTWNISIISTNYDIILDNALLKIGRSINYSVPMRGILNQDWYDDPNARRSITTKITHPHHPTAHLNKGDIPLIKIHGSLNWLYCRRCDEADVTLGEKAAAFLNTHRPMFLCSNTSCTATYETLLVTPTMLKVYDNRLLKGLWQTAGDSLNEADLLLLVGYSLPEADYLIRALISASFLANDNLETWVVENSSLDSCDPCDLTRKRYEQLFGDRLKKFDRVGLQGLLSNWASYFPV